MECHIFLLLFQLTVRQALFGGPQFEGTQRARYRTKHSPRITSRGLQRSWEAGIMHPFHVWRN